MLFLTVRTDKPEAEIGLFDNNAELDYCTWHAHRQLSLTIHHKIQELLEKHHKSVTDLEGIVCFRGPGSFTGLRIGLTVANAMAYGLGIPIVATMGEQWIKQGNDRLHAGEQDEIALPHYGSEAHITLPRK